jgi:broad specificity phosphatase PhoE
MRRIHLVTGRKDQYMFFYLIRHAQPDYAARVPYHRPPGPGLTEHGQAQAHALPTLLRSAGIERVASSPLRRCIMTAEPLAEALGVPLVIDPDLAEMQPAETPADVAVRMLRAALTQTDRCVVALVGHAAPLTQLLRTLTHDAVQLPPKDRRGNHLSETMVWGVYQHEGQWIARHLPPGGVAS